MTKRFLKHNYRFHLSLLQKDNLEKLSRGGEDGEHEELPLLARHPPPLVQPQGGGPSWRKRFSKSVSYMNQYIWLEFPVETYLIYSFQNCFISLAKSQSKWYEVDFMQRNCFSQSLTLRCSLSKVQTVNNVLPLNLSHVNFHSFLSAVVWFSNNMIFCGLSKWQKNCQN